MSKKAANYGIAVSVIGILIVAFIGGFYFSESKTRSNKGRLIKWQRK